MSVHVETPGRVARHRRVRRRSQGRGEPVAPGPAAVAAAPRGPLLRAARQADHLRRGDRAVLRPPVHRGTPARPDRSAGLRGTDGTGPERRLLVRNHHVRTGRLRAVRLRPPGHVPGRVARRGPRRRRGHHHRVRRGLPGRGRRRGPEHDHQRRAGHPDPRGPGGDRRLPERARRDHRGRLRRPDLVAVGGARRPGPDVLAALAGVRGPGAAERPEQLADHLPTRSPRTWAPTCS